jgi:uncharacterized damage-inducible protein DinB
MPLKDALIAELKQESSSTKKMLEKVPLDKKDWKPHEKSMTLGRLATHVADTTHWASDIIHIDDFDFMKDYKTRSNANSQEELLATFQANLDKAIADLEAMTDEDFNKPWSVRRGEQVMFRLPKKVAIRGWAFNHLVHHRGQLSVYLRLLNVPVPGMYGPSADEQM